MDDGDCVYKTNGSEAESEMRSKEKELGVANLPGRGQDISPEKQVVTGTRTEFWEMIAFVEPEKG